MTTSYGERINEREYRRRVLALYEGPQHSKNTHQSATSLRRRELDLTIDHRLGADFPRERREALWKAQQRLHRRKLPTLMMSFISKAFGSQRPIEEPLYELVLREYGRVLSPSELSAMVDIPTSQLPR